MATGSDWGGGCAVLFIVVGILAALADEWGPWVWTVPVLWLLAYFLTDSFKRGRARRAPCQHGTIGAKADRSVCSLCVNEYRQWVLTAKLQRRMEEAERRAERQRHFDAWKKKARTPAYLRQVDPRRFERIVCLLFSAMGYEVEETTYVGDEGVDGFLRRDGRLSILQCKRVQSAVGQPVLRDLWGNVSHHGADEGIVVTTGSVSRQARDWARGKPIRIIELNDLTALIRQHLDEDALVPESFHVTANMDIALDVCPICGKDLKLKSGRRGKFLGCSGYPTCGFTKSAPRSKGGRRER
jgi:hypothetical protein